MITFEFDQVREFAEGLNARLDQCESGEGMECQNLDATLNCNAEICEKFIEKLGEWGRGIFSGEIAFDEAAEQLWLAELTRFLNRSEKLHARAMEAEGICFELSGRQKLQSQLYLLVTIKEHWVSPRLSVGPSARLGRLFDKQTVDEMRAQLATLPQLPGDWMRTHQNRARAIHHVGIRK